MPQRNRTMMRSARLVASLLAASSPLSAQRPAPVGAQVSPAAVGSPAPTPTPVGGLRTTPLNGRATQALQKDGVRKRLISGSQNGTLLLTVPDAPLVYGVVPEHIVSTHLPAPEASWFPTADPPSVRPDTSVSRVDAWRDVIVNDMVCNGVAVCLRREQRIRARWMPMCGCYAFVDGWNRIWRVE